jgi:electron transfer flavoprotein alpha subunit
VKFTGRYGIEAERKEIWVFLEQNQGNLEGVSLELLAKGRQLADLTGWPLVGLLMGHAIDGLAQAAVAHGADQVILADHPLLQEFTVDGYTHVAFQALMKQKPSVFLLGATPNGRDLAGRLAVRLRTGLNADCTDLRLAPERGVLVSEVSGFGGGVLALIEMQQHRPQMATIRPGVFPPAEPDLQRTGQLLRFDVELAPEMIRTRVVEQVIGEGVDLTQAPVLVAGGRGVEGDFQMLSRLASLLGGDVGATRPPVDEGYIERERQIGQTGVVCRPRVAIACGISGAFHFVVGIQEAELVIAINSDPAAPIFDEADYCVVGDVHQVVPALIAALERVGEATYA